MRKRWIGLATIGIMLILIMVVAVTPVSSWLSKLGLSVNGNVCETCPSYALTIGVWPSPAGGAEQKVAPGGWFRIWEATSGHTALLSGGDTGIVYLQDANGNDVQAPTTITFPTADFPIVNVNPSITYRGTAYIQLKMISGHYLSPEYRYESQKVPMRIVSGYSVDVLIYDSDSMKPIAGATVQLRYTGIGELSSHQNPAAVDLGITVPFTANTDMSGYVHFKDIPPGGYEWSATAGGYANSVPTMRDVHAIDFVGTLTISIGLKSLGPQTYMINLVVATAPIIRIQGAKVTIIEMAEVEYSDDQGQARFLGLVAGTYHYKVEAVGYKAATGVVTLPPGVSMTVQLQPTNIPNEPSIAAILYVNDVPVQNGGSVTTIAPVTFVAVITSGQVSGVQVIVDGVTYPMTSMPQYPNTGYQSERITLSPIPHSVNFQYQTAASSSWNTLAIAALDNSAPQNLNLTLGLLVPTGMIVAIAIVVLLIYRKRHA